MECPYCGKKNVSQKRVVHQDGEYIHYTCNDCGTEWES